MPKALFLDRDGVINQEISYLIRPEDVRWVDGIFSLCRTAQSLGYALVVVTNQSGIARGFYTPAQFEALMVWMRQQLAAESITLDAVYHCPYHPDGQGEWRREHPDRKPGPGMLLRAAQEHNLDLSASIMIGDRCGDVGAANAAGLRQAFLIAGTEPGTCGGIYQPITSLTEVEAWLREND